ncbi:TonB-dependent siderophore receptor [Nitrospira moscoviensis]|uniref:TonB-dependent siderophore receptor n=1 Tax=Nitrospira moscoviensis TaxID=42253 RepID=A0A0K2G8Y0_NITMO|nr:TonB-dependent receptor [Nitrospira moscoviensis]ALA57324.1 TonB-dependent siderophore receptor [Nitrospira moscoviensis]
MRIERLRLVAPLSAALLAIAVFTGSGFAADSEPPEADDAVTFDIPPQPLPEALVAFSARTKLHVVYEGPIAHGVRSPGVTGVLTPTDALRRLLDGTGLSYRFIDRRTITLDRAAAVAQPAPASLRHSPPPSGAPEGEKPVLVPEVAVTATRTERSLAAIPQAVTVVTKEQIEEQRYVSRGLVDILAQLVPGMAPSTQSLSNFGQGIRGRNVLVLIDGVPQGTSRQSFRELMAIDPYAVERIEVVRGATAIYGDGATGGIINIITKQAGEGKPSFTTESVVTSQPTNPTASIGGRFYQSASGQHGGFDYSVSGSYERFGGFFDADGSRVPPDPNSQGGLADSNAGNLFVKLGKNFGAQRLQLTANHYRIFQNTDYTTDPIVNTTPGRQPARALKGLQLDQDQGSVNTVVNMDYHHRDFFGSRIHAQVYYRHFFTRFFPFDGRAFSSFGNSIIQSHIASERAGTRLEIETPLPIPAGARAPLVLWGLDFNHERTDQPVSIMDATAFTNSGGLVFNTTGERPWTPPITMRNLGLFAQFEWQVLERLLVRAGARHERVGVHLDDFRTIAGNAIVGGDKEFNKTVFNAGGVLTVTKAVSLYGSFSQGFSIPDISRVLRTAGAGTVFETAGFRPQTVNNYEAGVRGQWSRLQTSLAYFYTRSKLNASFAPDLSIQFAPEWTEGVEGTLDVQPDDRWRLGGTVSYVEGKLDLNNNGNYTWLDGFRIPPMKVTGYIEHETWPEYHWRNRVQVLFAGWRDRFSNSTAFGRLPVEGYAVVDLLSSIKAGPGTLRFGVQNLLNNRYFPVVSQLQSVDSAYTAARGMLVSLGYSVTY